MHRRRMIVVGVPFMDVNSRPKKNIRRKDESCGHCAISQIPSESFVMLLLLLLKSSTG
jgi:hypothetical protein